MTASGPPKDPHVGTVVMGKYAVLTKLGEGGMGRIYEAENASIGRRVALKILNPAFATNEEAGRRFALEARAAAQIGHPNIIDVLDMGRTEEGVPVIVMERLEGEDLLALIGRAAPMRPALAIDIAQQVLGGLGAAHAVGIVHRDLKPENVFLTRKGQRTEFVKILDFGVALFHSASDARSSRITRDGSVVGTPAYMSPEQAAGATDVDRRTDVYAVGVLLYEMLAGRLPYDGKSYNEIIVAIASRDPAPLAEVAGWIPSDLAAVVARAMARDPSGRFQTAHELSAALDPFVDAIEIEVPASLPVRPSIPGLAIPRENAPTMDAPVPLPTPAIGPRPRRVGLYALAAAVAAAGVVSAIALGGSSGDATPRARPAPRAARTNEPARSTAPEARLVSLDVSSNVAGARVLLDGREMGTTPLHSVVAEDDGAHVLRVEAEGHVASERTVPLAAPVQLVVDLSPVAPAAPAKGARKGRKRGLIFDEDVY